MFKILQKKFIMTFVVATVVGGASTKTFPVFRNIYATVRNSQVSNTANSQNIQNDEDLNSLSGSKNTSDNSKQNNSNSNKQKAVSSKSKKSTSNKVVKKQETTSSVEEKTSDSGNKETTTSSQSEYVNSKETTENKNSTNTTLKTEIPTIHYDRTTSIYANDNVTLLRVEYYKNNKLTYYSVVEKFDAATKSYTERIYLCNRETNIDTLARTDVYVNGKLTKSY